VPAGELPAECEDKRKETESTCKGARLKLRKNSSREVKEDHKKKKMGTVEVDKKKGGRGATATKTTLKSIRRMVEKRKGRHGRERQKLYMTFPKTNAKRWQTCVGISSEGSKKWKSRKENPRARTKIFRGGGINDFSGECHHRKAAQK